MFLRTCQAKKLDPLENGEVWLIKYDDKVPASMVVGYHAYVRRAERNPDYRGYEAGIVVIRNGSDEPIYKEGSAVYKQIGEELIGGWCRVYRAIDGRPETPDNWVATYAEVSLDEYSTGKSNWNSKPATMIRKCAIAQAFRGAFPNDYEGLYTEDEMVASGAIPTDYEEVKPTEIPEDRVITQEERQKFMQTIADNFPDNDSRNNVFYQVLSELGIKSSTNMTISQQKAAIELVEKIAADVDRESQPVEE